MKETKSKWVGRIPNDWKIARVKMYSKISAGGTPDRENLEYWNGDINWMASGEVHQKKVKYTAEKITKKGMKNSAAKLLPKGTVMLALNGQGKTKGTTAILEIESTSNQSLASFQTDEIKLHNLFLYYYFECSYQNIRGIKGEDRDGLNLFLVGNIEIALPKYNEQKKIAEFLDNKVSKINRITELLEQEIKKLVEHKQLLITEKVTGGINNNKTDWKIEKLKYYFTTNKGLSITRENLEDFGIPVMSYGQIHSKYGVRVNPALDELPFVNRSYLKNKMALLNYGDFIFADTSEDIEGSGNFSTNFGNELFFAGYHTIVVRLKDFVNNDFRYFMYLFDSEWFRNKIQSKVSGVKVYSVTQQMLKNEEIIIPTRKEQEKIADFLETKVPKINQSIEILRKEIDILKEARKSIIFEYVTGKKRVEL